MDYKHQSANNKNKRRTKQHRPKSGAERYKEYVKRDERREVYRKKQEILSEAIKEEREEGTKKGVVAPGTLEEDKNPYLIAEEEQNKSDKKAVRIRKCIFALICLIASLLLNLVNVRIPFTPTLTSIEFTAFPELLAALCVNPVAALAIMLIKDALYYLINPASLVSLPNKAILNAVFILLVWILFCIISNTELTKKKNAKRELKGMESASFDGEYIALSGLLGGVVTAVLSVFSFKYTVIPLLIKETGNMKIELEILKSYNSAYTSLAGRIPFIFGKMPELKSLTAGLVIYNIPIVFFKYLICALLAALITPAVKAYLNKE